MTRPAYMSRETLAPVTLLTIREVADRLRCSTRKVMRLPLPWVKVGASRRYDPSDVEAYLERQKQCPSSDAHGRRTGTVRYKSQVVGLSEALARTASARR